MSPRGYDLCVPASRIRKARYILRFPGLLGELAEGMARIGQHRQALEVIHEALAQCEGTDERWSMANLWHKR